MSLTLTLAAGAAFVAKVAGGMFLGRGIMKLTNAVGERIFPYNTSKAYKQQEQSAANQRSLETMRQAFQRQQQNEALASNERISLYNRQMQMLLAQYSTHVNLRHTLLQDAIRNFPLNISPLVLLENNNINISFLLDTNLMGDYTITDSAVDKILDSLDAPKPISVFITPVHIDSRLASRDVVATNVSDAVVSQLESIFVAEYGRHTERPIIFYPTAWNPNVRSGHHAAEELYYFLRHLPTMVVEPRFDGRNLKIMFSCWGLGYSDGIHIRQEISLPLDWPSVLVLQAVERSENMLKLYGDMENPPKALAEQLRMCRHNVDLFRQLNLGKRIEKRINELVTIGHSDELDELGDFSRMFALSSADTSVVSDFISSATGMVIAALADTHHLLAADVEPRLPYIYGRYFKDYVNPEILSSFERMYEQTYNRLAREYPEQESKRAIEKVKIIHLLGGRDISHREDMLYTLRCKCSSMGAEAEAWDADECIDFYIDNMTLDDEEFRSNLIPLLTPAQKERLQLRRLRLINE